MKAKGIGRAIERIEIIRSSLRWTSHLDKAGVHKILSQANQLRNELLMLSRHEKFAKKQEPRNDKQLTEAERRQSLLDDNFSFTGIFGDNPVLLTVLETVAKAAKTDFPVIIEGESGTGKELVAKVVHANSPRANKMFVSVNCGAIPTPLLESELFGHAKGAFTGADTPRKGKFELANGGTLFLDELGELSLENQVKLLRALQTGEIQRVGADHNIIVDVRIVAATNRKLHEMTRQERFREDLYYRLGVVTVTIPPLRERRDEIPLLIDYFVREAADKMRRSPVELSPRLKVFLQEYTFPGNIRELQNIIYRVSCLADQVAGLQHLPDIIRPDLPNVETFSRPEQPPLKEVRAMASDLAEEQFLKKNLARVHGQVTVLAQDLGMNRSYLQNLMKKHALRSRDFKKR